MGSRQLPVIAVNLGKLGFLADVSPDELPAALHDFRAGKLTIIEHLMLDCRVSGGGVVRAQKIGLNEAAVHSGPPFTLMEVHLYVDSELVTTYSCDGLIVSTPVGSTAHSLSAGGPILQKNLQAFVIMPISPHTLTNRPVVDAADRVYEMEVPWPRAETSVVVDGQVLCRLQPGDRVSVRRADCRFRLVAAPGHSYYRTLREKLGWSGRIERRMKDEG
jgi:NAD+ kinase